MIKIYLIKQDFANTRLDRWFKKNVCEVPQSLIEGNIRKGKIKVNNIKKKSSYKVQENDQITVNSFYPAVDKNKKIKEKYKANNKEIISTSQFVIADNENFIVINKPAGIAVQSGTKSKKNILDILSKTKYFKNSSPYTVHRIDKETTGVLIIAKNRKYAQLFTSLFRIRKIYKTYLGVALGQFEKQKGTFNDVLYIYEGERKIKTRAITHFKVIDSNINYSLLKLNPETGRKHQLRRQLLIHNHPILGDSKYRISDKYKNKKNTLMLHAYKINFSINGKKYEFAAEPAIAFKRVLKEKYLKSF